jgi:hypothetical protein
LNFHVLGGANFRDIFFYELIKLAVLKFHNIHLNITYDSSGIYKQVMVARYLHVMDKNKHIRKMDIKSPNLENRFFDGKSVFEMYQSILDDVARKNNFIPISLSDGVYSSKTKTFHEDVKVYSILYTLGRFSEIQNFLKEQVKRVFPLYESGETEAFFNSCLDITQTLNQGKLTKKQKIKSHSIEKSIDMLKNLDEDYCQYLVDKSLSKDEFTDLDETKEVLTI